jgi:SpoU rRNA methylase family enzyme
MTRLQLKRVQDLIHAQNLKGQYSSVVEQQLADELKLDEQTRDLEFYQRMDVLTLDFKYVGQILGEIIRISEKEIDEINLYWELMPNFFKHLDYEAANHNTGPGKYMDRLIKRKRNKAGIEVVVITPAEANAIQEKVIEPSLKDEVSKLTIEDMRDLIQVVQRDLMKAVESEAKIKEFREILPIVQQANLPNLEVLDKLMRYQTSLNNQLSKQMGELIELEKRYSQKD